MSAAHIVVLADHSVLLAIPAFVPAIAVAGVVVYIAMKDRRTPDDAESADVGDDSA